MEWVYNDGGRSRYFEATDVGDCVTRAISIATGKDYKEVYNDLKRLNGGKSCRNGTPKEVGKKYLASLGWTWIPTMQIGSGCTTHLCEEELPKGTLIVQVSRHLTCVKDGVIYDTYDCSRGETRCVYGYWLKREQRKALNTRENRTHIAEVNKEFNDARKLIVNFDGVMPSDTLASRVVGHIDEAIRHLEELKRNIKGGEEA